MMYPHVNMVARVACGRRSRDVRWFIANVRPTGSAPRVKVRPDFARFADYIMSSALVLNNEHALLYACKMSNVGLHYTVGPT